MSRVCMIVTSDLDRDPRVQKEASFASSHGYDVTVICRSYTGPKMPYTVLPLQLKRQSNRLSKYLERIWANISMAYLTFRTKPQIVHANDLDTLPAGYIAAKLSGAKLIYDAHEFWSEAGRDVGTFGTRLAISAERFISRRAAAVVTVSPILAQYMARAMNIPAPNVVMNAPYYVQPKDLEIGDWVNQFKGKKIVLYQGAYSKNRGLKEAVLAAKYLRDDIVLVFRGLGPLEDEIRSLIREENLSQRIVLVPPVPMNEMVKSAAGADLGLVLYAGNTKNYQGIAPNKMFEYIMARVPAVGSDMPFIREVLSGNGVGEVFKDRDSQDLARVITEILDNPALLERMKTKCDEIAAQFAWETEGAKLLKVYENVIPNAP